MDLQILSLFSLIVVLLYALARATDLIEDAFVYLARKLNINEFFIGFLILSIVSSSPEYAIIINAKENLPELSVANLIGSSTIMLTLVLGFTAIKTQGISFRGKFKEREVVTGLGLIGLTVLVVLDQELYPMEGVCLILAYFAYVFHVYLQFKTVKTEDLKHKLVHAHKLWRMLIRAFAGIVIILISSSLMIDTVIEIGTHVHINEAIIGLFVVAFGTNIPEIMLAIRARTDSHKRLALGNFIGSATMNAFSLGFLIILAHRISLSGEDWAAILPALGLLSATLVLFFIFSWTGKKITKQEGAVLVGLYFLLILFEIVVQVG